MRCQSSFTTKDLKGKSALNHGEDKCKTDGIKVLPNFAISGSVANALPQNRLYINANLCINVVMHCDDATHNKMPVCKCFAKISSHEDGKFHLG